MHSKFHFTVWMLLLMLSHTLLAQVPQAVNFQAVARDKNGAALANTTMLIRFSILEGSSSGTMIYQEIRTVTTNAFGSFAFPIGYNADFVTSGNFAEIEWAGTPKYFKVDYDPTNKYNWSNSLDATALVSVPYAFVSDAVTYIDITNVREGDALVYNENTRKFEAKQVTLDAIDWSKVQNKPTLADRYYVDSLTNQLKKKIAELDASIEQLRSCGTLSVKDFDGNNYTVVKIGSQCWLKENLRTTHTVDGQSLTNGNNQLSDSIAYYYFYDMNQKNGEIYGMLYNWAAVEAQICPDGWHVPTMSEWDALANALGGSAVAGGKMKDSDNLWQMPNIGADNESGFSALPGGYLKNGQFTDLGSSADFWTSTLSSPTTVYYRALLSSSAALFDFSYNKNNAYSVRCIK